ncbi:photosystem reaction center subunit H [Angustibacter aerolatus]|uniref:Photosystem reaction center subunit H n=1 Tax=Angustibacter aerolatus TaxID=1162965 RepID=A0ABQ6JK18_9ACTN|nr:PRC and DUF2382 domain-containing protein [Angustibacter aerolatus]GMA87469.1 photosystem reaction center subunit H [Angustibacter aerolatus]
MINHEQADRLKGATVYSSTGDKIGKAGDIYLDDQTGDVAWATVNTGLFGTNESFVPLREANLQDDGGDARIDVPFTKDKIKDAPNVAADGHLSPEEERELYTYYGMSDAFDSTAGVSGDANVGGEGYAAGNGYAAGQGQGLDDRNEHGTEGHDTSGPTTDDAMTRSEQHLNVGTERVAAGKARLRKYVTTEQQTVTVPVTREEVRLEREPITDANRGNATAGPEPVGGGARGHADRGAGHREQGDRAGRARAPRHRGGHRAAHRDRGCQPGAHRPGLRHRGHHEPRPRVIA